MSLTSKFNVEAYAKLLNKVSGEVLGDLPPKSCLTQADAEKVAARMNLYYILEIK